MLRNMGVAGHGNSWGMDPVGITEDENLENIFSILDFPMESLEGNGFAGDWDVSESHYLGPIPSNVLMEPLMNLGPSYKPSGPATSIDGAVQRSSGSDIVQQSNPLVIQEPVYFQNQSQSSQSPISVLESSGSCSTQKNSPVKSYLAVPVRTRSKRVRASGVNPWLSVAPLLADASAYKESLNVGKHKLRRRSSPQLLPVVPESNKISIQKAERRLRVTDKGMLPAVAKRCLHCQVTKTPQWREGPAGAKTLCNACGMRYRSGRLFPEYRPAASPTFVPTIHSNSHKKVVQIRSKGKQVPGMIYQTSTPPPQPEFVPSNPHNKVVVPIGSKGGQVPDNMFKMYETTTSSPHPEFVPSIPSNCLQRSVVDMYEVPVSMNDTPTSLQPESVTSIHLNSHKEVVEMRRSKGGRQVTDNVFRMYETQTSSPQSEMYDPPASPQPEFVPMSSYLFDYIRETGAAVSPPV